MAKDAKPEAGTSYVGLQFTFEGNGINTTPKPFDHHLPHALALVLAGIIGKHIAAAIAEVAAIGIEHSENLDAATIAAACEK